MGYDNEYTRRIVLDIETVASPEAESFLDPVRAPSNYKDEAKIAAYKSEKLAEIVGKAALEADLCEVVAVGWWLEGSDGCTSYTRADLNEVGLLESAWAAVEAADVDADLRTIVGFNVLGFDLPVLIRRSQLLGVRHPFVNMDRYRTNHIDLIERLTFNGKLTYRSLAFYCRRFGIPCQDAIAGAEIGALVASNDWAGVRSHNLSDVDKTARLAHRLAYISNAPKSIEVAA